MSHTLRRTLLFTFFPFHHDVRVSLHGTCFVIGQSRLQNQITLRLVFFSWQVLASFVYSARILEEFHLIHLDLSPTTDSHLPSPFHQRTIFRRTNYSFPLPLRDREVVTSFTIAALHHQCIWLHGLYRTHRFAVYALIGFILSICFSGTVGTRFLAWKHSQTLQTESLSFSQPGDINFLLNMLISLLFSTTYYLC